MTTNVQASAFLAVSVLVFDEKFVKITYNRGKKQAMNRSIPMATVNAQPQFCPIIEGSYK